jgi:cation:H+ antiporter
MLTYILFVIWFVLLIKGADLLVDGSVSVAKKAKISSIVIGLTIVAFGTSMPELVVNIFASATGNTAIAIGNVLWSNIANVLLILWISAIIYPLVTKNNTIRREIPLSILAALVLWFLANDFLIDGNSRYSWLTKIDGLILLSFFSVFMVYIFSIAKEKDVVEVTEIDEIKKMSKRKSVLYIVLWLIGLAVWGKWIVDGAVHIATVLWVSESLIGLTIVAIGTSLPELATSAIAAYKKEADIAIGNVVGSNIFNIFRVLWLSAIIRPLPFSSLNNIDILMTIMISVLLFLGLFVGKKNVLQRREWILFVLLYVAYVVFLVMTQG